MTKYTIEITSIERGYEGELECNIVLDGKKIEFDGGEYITGTGLYLMGSGCADTHDDCLIFVCEKGKPEKILSARKGINILDFEAMTTELRNG